MMALIRNVLSSVNPLAKKGRKAVEAAPASPFGGFRKKTMTATEFVRGAASLVPDAPTIYKVWGKHELDAGFREELMLAVSKLNDCKYCSWGHYEWAHIAGVSEEELAQIEQLDPASFDRKKWLAISYVRALVTAGFGAVSADLVNEMRANYTDTEIKEIELVAKVMDIANRGANTWDSMLSRLRGRPAADSRLIDEAVLSAAFLATAPVVVAILARGAKRPFREMARSLMDYTRRAEAQAAAPEPAVPAVKARSRKKQRADE
jgi:AhpD family alkylhydroperoxidase